MSISEIDSIAGKIKITLTDTNWDISSTGRECQGKLEFIHFKLQAKTECQPPEFSLDWSVPHKDMQFRWHAMCDYNHMIPADWGGKVKTNIADNAPFILLGDQNGFNHIAFAVSEAMRPVIMKAGICEENSRLACGATFFSESDAPMNSYEFTLRLDLRVIPFADAIRDAFAWYETFPEYKAAQPPPASFDPLYSAWYSYHQDVHANEMAAECRLAKPMGMNTIIVDDGWQTDDTNRGYAFCGDWEMSLNRFPDMKAHVDEVHKIGMKYMIWYSVPFVGFKSKNYARFKGKYLFEHAGLKTAVLDPRFPEVREFLINIWESAVRDWGLDGLKLDFIDQFNTRLGDPAIAENYAGRDIKSVPLAVDALLSEAMKRLSAIRPGILIEFRQSYIGPAIRKYGNMFRAGDCPADILTNRIRTLNLRLSSGNTAVHSDMLEWNFEDTPQHGALQILNILFSVPQISVRLAEIPKDHLKMLSFWLTFWIQHKDLLMTGYLTPLHPELNYPAATIGKGEEWLAAVYSADCCVAVPTKKTVYIVNAADTDSVLLELKAEAESAEFFDCFGNRQTLPIPGKGLSRIAIPESGLLILHF